MRKFLSRYRSHILASRKALLAIFALIGCLVADTAWANCSVSNSNINLGTFTSFHLDNNGTNSSGSAGISCSSALGVLSSSFIGYKISQTDNFLHRIGGTEKIPFILSLTMNGNQVQNNEPYKNDSSILLGLLFTTGGQFSLHARTTATQGLPAGTYRANVNVTWYWSICIVAGALCNNSTDDLKRASILGIPIGAVTEIGTGVTRTLTVELIVTRDCSLTVPTVNFGQAALPSQFPEQTNTINVRCTAGETYKVGIDNGANVGADGTTRRMASSNGHYLAYDIWKGLSGSVRWGQGANNWRASDTAEDNPTLNGTQSQGFRFRTQVRSDQSVPKGVYQDTVTVRVDF